MNLKKVFNNTIYKKIKKSKEIEISLCNFFNALEINVDAFDRSYEDVNDEIIFESNEHYEVILLGTKNNIHLVIKYSNENNFDILKKEFYDKLKSHLLDNNWRINKRLDKFTTISTMI